MEELYRLGPRALAEFLAGLGADRLIRTETELRAQRYTALDLEILRATGGDRFPAAPLDLVHDR